MTIPGVRTSLRVLVAEDDVDSVERTATSLRMHGHCVRTACNGPEAIACSKTFLPHLILLDIGMPGMAAYEAVRELRHIASAGETLIVAVAGHASPADKRCCAEAGFDLCIPKPIDFDILEQLVWLSREPDRLTEDSRQLARRQTSPFLKFVGVSIDMGNTFLDVASNTHDPSVRQGFLAKARQVQQTIAKLVQNRPNERSDLVEALDKLRCRYEEQEEQYDPRVPHQQRSGSIPHSA